MSNNLIYKYVKFGENFHIEFDWDSGNDIREFIIQFDYQLTRTETYSQIYNIQKKYRIILNEIVESKTLNNKQKKELFVAMYKLVAYTRDIKRGKGEYKLSYALISTLAHINLEFNGISTMDMAKNALYYFVYPLNKKDTHPYGSWKDIKYFCDFWIENEYDLESSILAFAFGLISQQIHNDFKIICDYKFNSNVENPTISLAAKWVPREKSKFGYLYDSIVMHYFTYSNYIQQKSAGSNETGNIVVKNVTNEHKKLFRQITSLLNKYLKTTQIFQCNNEWDKINFSKVTSITHFKQKNAFLKTTNKNGVTNKGKIKCAINYKKYILQTNGNKTNYVSPYDFVKQGMKLLHKDKNDTDVILLNILWEKNKEYHKMKKYNILPIIDMTYNMELNKNVPLYSAMGLGIRISELSHQKNTIITISEKPVVVVFNDTDLFMDKLKKIFNVLDECNISFGVDGNIYHSFNLLLQNCILNKMPQKQISAMNIVILSDMQTSEIVDDNTTEHDMFKCLNEKIVDKFNDAGKKSIGESYKCPHIMYWNMRSTNGFPYNSSTKTNISLISGMNFNNLRDMGANIENSVYYKKQKYMLKSSKERNIIIHKSCKNNQKDLNRRWENFQKKLGLNRYKRMETIFSLV